MSVDMGQAKVVGPEPEWVEGDVLQATRVDVGNPHLVLRWAGAELPERDELIALGSPHRRRRRPAAPTSRSCCPSATPGELDMVVYERGVGPTLACGTGACATVAAAHEWELVRHHRHRPHAGRPGGDRPGRPGGAHRRRHLRRHPRHAVAVAERRTACR